jgi:thioredoxin
MTDDSRSLLVFFAAESSGPARRMESLVAHVARKERARLRVIEIDVDKQPELAERFRVTTVPTLALVKDNRVVGRLEGRVSAPRLEQLLEAHLDEELAA